ncbi:hypothetical protein BC829DRAFT_404033, partial [Chytridium lagenaria]
RQLVKSFEIRFPMLAVLSIPIATQVPSVSLMSFLAPIYLLLYSLSSIFILPWCYTGNFGFFQHGSKRRSRALLCPSLCSHYTNVTGFLPAIRKENVTDNPADHQPTQ